MTFSVINELEIGNNATHDKRLLTCHDISKGTLHRSNLLDFACQLGNFIDSGDNK